MLISKLVKGLLVLSLFSATSVFADDAGWMTKDTLTVGTEGTYPPFTYHDEQGKLTGYDVEVARAVAEKLGLKIEFKETAWNALLAGLNSGRFDTVVNQVTMNDERRKKYQSSLPYSYSGAALAVRSSLPNVRAVKDLKGLKGGLAFTSNFADLVRQNQAEVVLVEGGLGQEMALVAQGRVDFTLNDRLAVLYYQKKLKVDDKIQVFDLPEEGTVTAGFIVRKDDTEKLKKLNQALTELKKEGKLAAISKQFFGVDISEQ
ncbi:transporter substrate-binding domain-containing protein [Gallibacterium salpingitidis]|uniref:transporter substrate-binding domain-containing protein n=1 Tax=Gallibacterium salpingitidis TaxID=505341 RepID=UPI00266EFC1C|nr:transporter substrate-binding domain-containing protein [Gallibacterium salpingitidis]WKS99888.1 transporter substrate-binding domain-containing protein [Gallibacterium salpingitidis]